MCNCVRTWFVLNHAPLEQEPHVLSVHTQHVQRDVL